MLRVSWGSIQYKFSILYRSSAQMSNFQTVNFFQADILQPSSNTENSPHKGPSAATKSSTSNELLVTDWYQHLKQLKNNSLSGHLATLPPSCCHHWLLCVDTAIHFHLPYPRNYCAAPAWNDHPVTHGSVPFTRPSRSTKIATISTQMWWYWLHGDTPGS